MTTQAPTVHEVETRYGPRWEVHVDGRHVPWRSVLMTREQAQAWADLLAQLPDGYLPQWHRARAGQAGALARTGWRIIGPYDYRGPVIDEERLVAHALAAEAGEAARAVVAAATAVAEAAGGRIIVERARRRR